MDKETEADGSASEIAEWMLSYIVERQPGYCYQQLMVRDIRETFGEEWSYRNKNGNWAIDKSVLAEFKKLKTPNLVWEQGSQAWRLLSDEQLAARKARADLISARRAEIRAQVERRNSGS